ncbi:MAG: methyltransferase domain-containing protein [Halioglobus sp.]
MYEYDEEFYRYISEDAARSARELLPVLLDALPLQIGSVLDVGCGAGAWLRVWKGLGAKVLGLDGDYVQPEQLLVEEGEFQSQDLSREFDLGRRFALAQSLEVAEHLPESSAADFVASLCRHADLVMFSAAPPGQGGENHLNEQPYDYWRDLFAEQGYRLYDVLRPSLIQEATIMPWYRYNTFLYVSELALPAVHEALAPHALANSETVPDLSPVAYRMRKRLISLLPRRASTLLARIKKGVHVARARARG